VSEKLIRILIAPKTSRRLLYPQLQLEDFAIAHLAKYQAGVYQLLNRALRGLEPLTAADFLMAKKIDSAIERARSPRDMIVYRGFGRNVVNELEPGDTFTDNGFSSASLSETVVRDRFAYGGGAIFQFVARKGTHAIYLGDLIEFPKPELEILFPRGASFRILSKEIRHGITYFMVELVSRRKHCKGGVISRRKARSVGCAVSSCR
jgi:hypothetical protein